MRTTIDIPDDLLRQAKSTAALQGVKLKDLIAGYIARGLSYKQIRSGHSGELPQFVPKSGIIIPNMTNTDIESMWDDEENHG